ncbi:hypothetical protein VB796_19145 [Arcicella sp. LKC2W]|uniref:hypothetical protein n=1 Tax=Arcicella sp. LKC2W TaxID=2984198 RepID=UPI002B206BBE|nr:hypothetical protein [Arcicella sp. LKC2W]MEA5461188.1 hypothetical protein [Arcicella sp. LKC2W]
MKKKLILFICLLLGVTQLTIAQDYFKKDTTKTVSNLFIIRLKDGTVLRGRIVEQNTQQSKIQTENMGTVTVNANQIVSMNLMNNNQSIGEKPYYENKFVNRFVITPSGFAMEKGAIEFHNYMLYYSEFAAALGNRFSLGFGFITILPAEGYNLKAKATLIAKENFNFSLTGNLIGGRRIGNTTVLIPSFSFGKKDNFLNVSPIFFTESRSGSFGMSVSYMKKASPTLTFFTENIFAVGNGVSINDGVILSGGLRFDRLFHAFDLNIVIPTNTGTLGLYLIPTVGYHLKLNRQ